MTQTANKIMQSLTLSAFLLLCGRRQLNPPVKTSSKLP